uniref:Uncharacterized protein n=1 Tax=Sinocyclocheilus grahami TaxID=75366 RepID=A0A672L8Q0_SINGR
LTDTENCCNMINRRGRRLVINEKRVAGRYNELAVKFINDGVNKSEGSQEEQKQRSEFQG